MPPHVDAVVVLNLPHRTDRLAQFLNGLPDDWPWPKPTIVPAIDGRDLPLPPGWTAGPGAFGCRESHVKVLQDAFLGGLGAILVLEDDAVFVPDLGARWRVLDVPGDWQMIMIGGQHIRPPTPAGPGLVRCHDTRRTHAYVARDTGIRNLLATWQTCAGHIDHELPALQREIPVYGIDPWLAGQAAGWSDITCTEVPERFWH